jgi:alpha-1,3-rhamnosyl/mannosyltransferase
MKRYVLDARAAGNHFPGIGRYVSNLARALPPLLEGEEHLTLLYRPEAERRWPLPAASRQVSLLALPASPFSLAQQWRVPRQLRALEARLYHSPYYLMPYRPGVPTLLTFYDFIPRLYPETVSPQARLLNGVTTRLALRAAAHVIAISEAARRDLLTFTDLKPAAVTAIPLAADPRFAPPPESEKERVRRTLGLPADYVLYLGINKPHKNLLRLLQAWEMVLRHHASPPLLAIAGAWDERYPEARELVKALRLGERARFLGPVAESDLPGLLGGATLFVYPSLYEGFGLPPLEAMACGTPVACSDRSSLPEVVGDAAALFDPLAPEAMAAVLTALLQDPERLAALREAGLARAAAFSWPATAAQTLALYRRLAG